MPLIDTVEIWTEIGQNITLSIAAMVTAYFGARGLSAWRRELSGRAKFKAARKILKTLYEARDAAEMFLGSLGASWIDFKEQCRCWSTLKDKIRGLQTLSLELEINFGTPMHGKILPLLQLVAASDQMMLESGGEGISRDRLQTYLRPSLDSLIAETVENIESMLSKHIR